MFSYVFLDRLQCIHEKRRTTQFVAAGLITVCVLVCIMSVLHSGDWLCNQIPKIKYMLLYYCVLEEKLHLNISHTRSKLHC